MNTKEKELLNIIKYIMRTIGCTRKEALPIVDGKEVICCECCAKVYRRLDKLGV